jgi:hypothetical protein
MTTETTTAELRKVGRYFRSTYPEGYASWAEDQRAVGHPVGLKEAGEMIYIADREMYDRVIGTDTGDTTMTSTTPRPWAATLTTPTAVRGPAGILTGATSTAYYVDADGRAIAADGDALARAARFATAADARAAATLAAATIPGTAPAVTRAGVIA